MEENSKTVAAPHTNVPKGYKKTKVGVIPEEWEEAKVKDCFILENGMAIKPEEWKETGIPIIRIQNLNQETADYNYYQGDFKERYSVKTGDLLFAWSGTKGVSFGARIWKHGDAVLNQHIFKASIQNKVKSKLIGYYLLLEAQQRVERLAHGFKSSFVHVTKKSLENVDLPLPTLPEQQKIADILSTWDRAIEKQQALIAQLQQRNKGLAQQLLTGKKRLPGFDGEWKEVRFSDIAKRVINRNEELNDNVVTISAKSGFIIQEEFFNKRVASETLNNYYLLKKGQFAYNKSISIGYPMGAFKRLQELLKAVVTPLYICFEIRKSENPEFFKHHFEVGLLERELRRIAQVGGRAHGLLNISLGDFFNMKLAKPSNNEQQAIAKVLDKAEEELKAQEQQLEALQEQKKGLMQKLLTGQLRVKIY